jgi:hypothetical protein
MRYMLVNRYKPQKAPGVTVVTGTIYPIMPVHYGAWTRFDRVAASGSGLEAGGAPVRSIWRAPTKDFEMVNLIDQVEPHARGLETLADVMEKAGIGLHATRGHVPHLRRMAAAMRVDATLGKLPHEFNDTAAMYAGAEAASALPLPSIVLHNLRAVDIQVPAKGLLTLSDVDCKLAARRFCRRASRERGIGGLKNRSSSVVTSDASPAVRIGRAGVAGRLGGVRPDRGTAACGYAGEV